MNAETQQATLTIALMAAFADGVNDEREREQIRRLAISLGGESGAPDVAKLYQDVLLRRVNLQSAAAVLGASEHAQLAYEMAVCVCDADGKQTEAEQQFLCHLREKLGLDAGRMATMERAAAAVSGLAEVAAPATVAAVGPIVAATANVSEVELDCTTLNYAIINGALELLPQSWASLAIVPLQIKMVFAIGKAYGYELDQGHIRELLATLGVGLTSQYLEQFGRKLLGGLLGKAAGGLVGRLGKTATGIAFSFATTYALGQVARRYYAGGRQMTGDLLRDSFEGLLGPAKRIQAQYLPQIEQKANSLDMGQIMAMVRGK